MASNQDQYNEKNSQIIAAFEDLLKQSFSALNLNGAGVGAAAGADSIDEIAVGDAAKVRSAIGFENAARSFALAVMQQYGYAADSAPSFPLTDLSNSPDGVKSGVYSGGTQAGTPSGFNNSIVTFLRYNTTRAYLSLTRDYGGANKTISKTYDPDNGWSGWVHEYSGNNIVGAVSKNSNGSPSGAVIESGGNDGRRYRRYADGSQDVDLYNVKIDLTTSNTSYTISTPASFSAIDSIQVTACGELENWGNNNDRFRLRVAARGAASSLQLIIAANPSEPYEGATGSVNISIKGRW